MFLTHLHSDHLGDYFNYLMLGWYNGITAAPPPSRFTVRDGGSTTRARS